MSATALMFVMLLAGQIAPGTEKDFGWEIDSNDGALQYIVQVSPELAARMQQKSVQFPNGQEATSEIPNELVGRATRVVIRIGSMNLPRTPSLQEIDRMKRFGDPINPSSTAQLDPGIYKQLEPPLAYNIGSGNQPVQTTPLPSFPNEPLGDNGLRDPAPGTVGSLRDDAANALSSALSDMKAPEGKFPDPSLLAQKGSNAVANLRDQFLGGASGGADKFNSLPKQTDPQLGNANTQTFPALPNNSGQLGNPNTNSGSSYNGTTQPQSPVSTFGAAPSSYDRLASNPALPGSNRMTQPNEPYGQQNYPPNNGQGFNTQTSPGYIAAPLQNQYDPRTDPRSLPDSRVARNDTPTTAQATPYLNPTTTTGALGGVGSGNGRQGAESINPTSTTADTAVKLLFLVSLLVNLYLGILLRKLLTRFRALLTNVRSQMA